MSTSVIVVIVVVLVLIAAVLPLLGYLGARQRKALMGYAETQGWTYRDHDQALSGRYTGAPFVDGPDARAEAVISGRFAEFPFAAYAYTFRGAPPGEDQAPESTRTVPVVALLIDSGLPDLDVVPRAGSGAGAPSGRAVTPVSPDFAAAFVVGASDDRFAVEVLRPRLMHDLMAHPDHAWAFRGGDLLSIGSWNGKPERIPRYLDHLAMILHAVPDAEWEAYGGRPGSADVDRRRPDQPNSSST